MIELIPVDDPTYDFLTLSDGVLSFPNGERRAQIVKLIAGGAYRHDAGYYDADREATITGTVDAEQLKLADKYLRDGILLYFDDDIGVYSCYVKSVSVSGDQATISLSIDEKLILYDDVLYPPAPEPTPPVEADWHDVTSDTYWQSSGEDTLTWNGSAWTFSAEQATVYFELDTLGASWITDFRPTKARLTYSKTNLQSTLTQFEILNADGTAIYGDTEVPTSGAEFSLIDEDFDAPINLDFQEWSNVEIPPAGYTIVFSITKIEFYGIKTW